MKISCTLLMCLLFVFGNSQETIYSTISHQEEEREYIMYVPESYDESTPVPLVFCFHGYGSNAQTNFNYTKFKDIADVENFIVVYPQGAIYNNSTHWNVGGWINGSPYDDVSFTNELLDELIATYSINEERVYSTGMSNGGYFSFLLACQLSDRIAAIASVTGSMTPYILQNCSPQHPMPVLQIHGTVDEVVPYDGSAFWTESINDVMTYWNTYDECETELIKEDIPNTSTTDFTTVEKYVFTDCKNGISNEHFKVIGGGHDWPGAWGNMDINASEEVWRFFSQYDINGAIGITSIEDQETTDFSVYPNPASHCISINLLDESPLKYKIYDTKGNVLKTGDLSSFQPEISIQDLTPSIYFIEINNEVQRFVIIQ